MEAEHYNLLHRLLELELNPLLAINIDARFHDDDRNAYNTLAEIPGTGENPEIVMTGGHLDSWHASAGAVDNAAGVAITMEAMRILSVLEVKPKRTIRIALWSGEEQGLHGSYQYVRKHLATRPDPEDPEERLLPRSYWRSPGWPITPLPDFDRFSAYFNVDNGSGRIRGIYTEGNAAVKPIFSSWFGPFSDLSAGTVVLGDTGGTDHESFDDVGLPGFQFIQDGLDYRSRLHHTNIDSYDHAVEADMKQASTILAAFLYHAATMEERMPREVMPVKPTAVSEQDKARRASKARRARERQARRALDMPAK
jgi:Zn-dependent M28 family amino/carboxypeptidase